MSRRRTNRTRVKPIYTFILSWLFLSAFLPMFLPGTFLLSLGLCGMLSYFMGRNKDNSERQKAENDHQRTAAKLTNEAFLSKAPAQVVAAEKEKVARLEALIANLRASVETMEKM